MIKRYWKRVVLAILASLGIASLSFWLWLRPGRAYPVEWFMPGKLAACLRLGDAPRAWEKHWQRRPGPKPEAALEEILLALDKWPRWVEKYGEKGARLRLTAYQEAIFEAIGSESWLLFGEWGAPGAEEAGLVLLIRSDSPVKTRVGPFVDLLFDKKYKIEKRQQDGVTLYDYKDEQLGRNLTFCHLGGWICATLRRREPAPLPALIAQVNAKSSAAGGHANKKTSGKDVSKSSLLYAELYPEQFWATYANFAAQRGRETSKDSRKLLKKWRESLAGIEQVSLRQTGPSLLDLEMDMVEKGKAGLAVAAPATVPLAAVATNKKTKTATGQFSVNELGQAHLDLATLKIFRPLLKDKVGDWLEKAGVDDDLLEQDYATTGTVTAPRLGFSALAAPQAMFPSVLVWLDTPPLENADALPLRHWLARVGSEGGQPGDFVYWANLPSAQPVSPAEAIGPPAWLDFETNAWSGDGDGVAPRSFLTLNFGAIQTQLGSVPTLFMKEKAIKKLNKSKRALTALDLAFGGVALRLDDTPQGYKLSSRTP